ncbi:hypothetical protein, partial [Bradyrhizobium guangdongense]|uniref:hypothetical protein n=1 Tax=Bradyrhizobium guangdongense TaxID=1325090 RepID=UPI001AED0F25
MATTARPVSNPDRQAKSRRYAGFLDLLRARPRGESAADGAGVRTSRSAFRWLVPLPCAPAGPGGDPAGSHLLQLPEGAHEARAEARYDEQQQEGLIDGRDMYHGNDKATPVLGV